MIILARPVAYGGNAARYAMEKEDATVVKVNYNNVCRFSVIIVHGSGELIEQSKVNTYPPGSCFFP